MEPPPGRSPPQMEPPPAAADGAAAPPRRPTRAHWTERLLALSDELERSVRDAAARAPRTPPRRERTPRTPLRRAAPAAGGEAAEAAGAAAPSGAIPLGRQAVLELGPILHAAEAAGAADAEATAPGTTPVGHDTIPPLRANPLCVQADDCIGTYYEPLVRHMVTNAPYSPENPFPGDVYCVTCWTSLTEVSSQRMIALPVRFIAEDDPDQTETLLRIQPAWAPGHPESLGAWAPSSCSQ